MVHLYSDSYYCTFVFLHSLSSIWSTEYIIRPQISNHAHNNKLTIMLTLNQGLLKRYSKSIIKKKGKLMPFYYNQKDYFSIFSFLFFSFFYYTLILKIKERRNWNRNYIILLILIGTKKEELPHYT